MNSCVGSKQEKHHFCKLWDFFEK